jgi:glutathione S-transferase
MLILRYSPASPYARKLRIAADILGLTDRIEIQSADLSDPNDSIRQQNPLGKIPVLLLEDGSSLYDSRVIAEYFDHLAGGGRLIPSDPARRFESLRLQALGDGINDAALLLRYETFSRPEPFRHADTIALQQGKVDRALAQLEASPPAGAIDIGHVAIASALGYQDLRFGGSWRTHYPRLVKWLDDFARDIPSFDATKVAA